MQQVGITEPVQIAEWTAPNVSAVMQFRSAEITRSQSTRQQNWSHGYYQELMTH